MTWLFWTIVACVVWTLTRMAIYSTFGYHQRRTPVSYDRTGGNNRLHDIEGEIKGETERAWRFYDGRETVWLPKSLCEWDEATKTMTLPEWVALEKGLI